MSANGQRVIQYKTASEALFRANTAGGFVFVHPSGREFFYCPNWAASASFLADYGCSVERAEAWLMTQPEAFRSLPVSMAPWIEIVVGAE